MIRLENKDAVMLKVKFGTHVTGYIAAGDVKLNVLFVGVAAEAAATMVTGDRFHIKEWNMTYSEEYGIGYVIKDVVKY
jgi:hypothetical protein